MNVAELDSRAKLRLVTFSAFESPCNIIPDGLDDVEIGVNRGSGRVDFVAVEMQIIVATTPIASRRTATIISTSVKPLFLRKDVFNCRCFLCRKDPTIHARENGRQRWSTEL